MVKVFNKWKDDQPVVAEAFVGVSETVPDDTLTVSEIFARYSIGSDLSDVPHRNPLYPSDDEDIEVMEEYDKLELAERRADIIQGIRESVKSEKSKPKDSVPESTDSPGDEAESEVKNETQVKEPADEQ